VIKNTIFEQFCGGENIQECNQAISSLASRNVGTILDYSVEGEDNETVFNETCREIIKTIEKAKDNQDIPFSVFKVTGIVSAKILEKVSSSQELSKSEQTEWNDGIERFYKICKTAFDLKVRLFVDAEESWIQKAIDDLVEDAMRSYNQEQCIIYNTLQMYRHDRLKYLKNQLSSGNHYLGFKLVRGAYMEKERSRATELNYPSPIQPNKKATDNDYNAAVELCIENINRVSICIGTHNELSSILGAKKMNELNIEPTDTRVYFSQLLGMSDHISFNLSNAGYKVAKYVPYGPVLAVIPYLTRRAQENSGMAGQMGRELGLINQEIQRRSNLKS
jgi:proline dehydrogenase